MLIQHFYSAKILSKHIKDRWSLRNTRCLNRNAPIIKNYKMCSFSLDLLKDSIMALLLKTQSLRKSTQIVAFILIEKQVIMNFNLEERKLLLTFVILKAKHAWKFNTSLKKCFINNWQLGCWKQKKLKLWKNSLD